MSDKHKTNKPYKNPKKEEYIYKIDRQWYGVRVRQVVRAPTKHLALQKVEQIKDYYYRRFVLGVDSNKTLGDAIKKFYEKKLQIVSSRDHMTHIRQYLNYLRSEIDPSIELINIKKIMLEDILQDMIEIKSAKTVRNMFSTINDLFKNCVKWEWLERAPIVELPSVFNLREVWLTHEKFELLVSALSFPWNKLAVIAVYTGLRRMNTLRLKRSQVHLKEKFISIEGYFMKNKKAHTIPICDDVCDAIQELIQKCGNDEYVCVNPNTQKPYGAINYDILKTACEKCGIEDFWWHDFRHTRASWYAQEGVPDHQIIKLMGWSDSKMMKRYVHLNIEHLRGAVENV